MSGGGKGEEMRKNRELEGKREKKRGRKSSGRRKEGDEIRGKCGREGERERGRVNWENTQGERGKKKKGRKSNRQNNKGKGYIFNYRIRERGKIVGRGTRRENPILRGGGWKGNKE